MELSNYATEFLMLRGMIWFGVSVIFGAYTSIVAQARGYSGTWFLGGFLFWFIALIAITGMPIRESK